MKYNCFWQKLIVHWIMLILTSFVQESDHYCCILEICLKSAKWWKWRKGWTFMIWKVHIFKLGCLLKIEEIFDMIIEQFKLRKNFPFKKLCCQLISVITIFSYNAISAKKKNSFGDNTRWKMLLLSKPHRRLPDSNERQ